MRYLAIAILPLTLVACTAEPAEEPAVEETPAAAEAPDMATANGTGPGTYDVTWEDGTASVMETSADGTYVATAADGSQISGTWAVVDGKSCFTPTGEDGLCWTEGEQGADGSFTATSDEGTTVTVKPRAAEAAE